MSFTLHPRLEKSTHFIGRTKSCQVLLKDNAHFPWILIVPEVAEDIEDLHQLPASEFAEVMFLVRQVSEFMCEHFSPEKLNVACIGNRVRQMHLHLVGRSASDPAWPGTVWASDAKKAYSAEEVIEICVRARIALNLED